MLFTSPEVFWVWRGCASIAILQDTKLTVHASQQPQTGCLLSLGGGTRQHQHIHSAYYATTQCEAAVSALSTTGLCAFLTCPAGMVPVQHLVVGPWGIVFHWAGHRHALWTLVSLPTHAQGNGSSTAVGWLSDSNRQAACSTAAWASEQSTGL